MKTLGIVGGLGPESTIEYYRFILEGYRARVPESSSSLRERTSSRSSTRNTSTNCSKTSFCLRPGPPSSALSSACAKTTASNHCSAAGTGCPSFSAAQNQKGSRFSTPSSFMSLPPLRRSSTEMRAAQFGELNSCSFRLRFAPRFRSSPSLRHGTLSASAFWRLEPDRKLRAIHVPDNRFHRDLAKLRVDMEQGQPLVLVPRRVRGWRPPVSVRLPTCGARRSGLESPGRRSAG